MESSQLRAQLGKYTLIAEIARGGMGVVYLARQIGPAGFEKLAVVKELKPELGEDEKFRGMFLDEARLAARLNHRNIVQTNEVGEDDGRYYMAMEYLDGRTLQSVRSRFKGPRALPLPTMLRIACDVLAGLHYAHELTDHSGRPLGIVHRDVSSHNVFLTYDGQVKVLDFGVAKTVANRQETEVGMLKGRVVCMAPEQVANDAVDRRADVFSMGVLLRDALTERRVWEGLGELEVVRELLAHRIPAFPLGTSVPDEVRWIIEKAMAPNREDRFPTAHAMRIAIEQYVMRIDPAGSLNWLGDALAKEFAEQRDRVKVVIEQSASSTIASELPVLPTSSREMTGTSKLSSLPRSGSGVKSSQTVVSGALPSLPPAGPSKKSTGLVLGAAAALLVVGVAVGAFAMRPKAEPAAAAPPPPPVRVAAPEATPATAPAPADTSVELTVTATPANASIYIDDALVENPWRAKYPRGGTHVVRITAPGHSPKSQPVTLSAATNISMSLDKAQPTVIAVAPHPVAPPPPPRPAEPPRPAPTPEPQPTGDIVPGGGKAPKRAIDPKNPYGTQ